MEDNPVKYIFNRQLTDTLNGHQLKPELNDFSGHFFQNSKVNLFPVDHPAYGYTEWFVIFFFGMLFLLVLVWYFFPERLIRLIYTDESKIVKRLRNNQFTNPGILLIILISGIFISSTTVVIYFILKLIIGEVLFENSSIPQVLSKIAAGVILYYFIRFLIIFISGFVFNTNEKSKQLLTEFLRIDVIQGMVFVPLVFFIYFSSPTVFIYTAMVLTALILLYKWYKVFFIGMSFANVSVFHNILYICTLEIIPLYALIKLAGIYQFGG